MFNEKPRILLCDDSPVERMALSRLLRDSGSNVDEAGDGAAAIAQIKKVRIDGLLLDLHMPNVDGFQVLCYVQEHHRALPVVLMSGMPPHKIQPKIASLPNQELPPLLIKPVDPDQLLDLLELQLSGELPTIPMGDMPPGDLPS